MKQNFFLFLAFLLFSAKSYSQIGVSVGLEHDTPYRSLNEIYKPGFGYNVSFIAANAGELDYSGSTYGVILRYAKFETQKDAFFYSSSEADAVIGNDNPFDIVSHRYSPMTALSATAMIKKIIPIREQLDIRAGGGMGVGILAYDYVNGNFNGEFTNEPKAFDNHHLQAFLPVSASINKHFNDQFAASFVVEMQNMLDVTPSGEVVQGNTVVGETGVGSNGEWNFLLSNSLQLTFKFN